MTSSNNILLLLVYDCLAEKKQNGQNQIKQSRNEKLRKGNKLNEYYCFKKNHNLAFILYKGEREWDRKRHEK
jgi:hypothetical protein